jgi:hypothetical protein
VKAADAMRAFEIYQVRLSVPLAVFQVERARFGFASLLDEFPSGQSSRAVAAQ